VLSAIPKCLRSAGNSDDIDSGVRRLSVRLWRRGGAPTCARTVKLTPAQFAPASSNWRTAGCHRARMIIGESASATGIEGCHGLSISGPTAIPQ
jgi:hypothetical protein